MATSPDSVLNPSDPGDDMQRRLRYQAVRAACFVVALFDDEMQIEEVFCEQHEDILVRYRTGRFRGVQVKTKLDGAVPHKAGDGEVIQSLKRFIDIEKDYPGYFDGYILANNCGFWRESKNGSNLHHLLDQVRGKAIDDLPKAARTYLGKLCTKPKSVKVKRPRKPTRSAKKAGKADSPAELPPATEPYETQIARALGVLQRIELDHKPSLEEMEHYVISALANCPIVGRHQLYSDLETIAKALIAEILEASAKAHASPKKQYFALCQNPAEAAADSIIAAKRFARQRAEEVIRRGFRSGPTPPADGRWSLEALPRGSRLQKAKMTAGGIVINDVDEALLQRNAAEYAFSTWLAKYGRADAERRYRDVRSAVLTNCNMSRDATRKAGQRYGPAMLANVKDRIQKLHAQAADTLHGLRYDQLLGVAGVLTEECLVWWSDPFDVPEEAVS